MAIEDFLREEIPLANTPDNTFKFYDYFSRLLGVWNPYVGNITPTSQPKDLLLAETERINANRGDVLPSPQTYQRVVHTVMQRVSERLSDFDLNQLGYLLTASIGDSVLAAARQRDNNPEFYARLEEAVIAQRGALANTRLQELNERFQERKYRDLDLFDLDKNRYQNIIAILGVKQDDALLESARTDAIVNQIDDITAKELRNSDFQGNQASVMRQQQIQCTSTVENYHDTVTQGRVCVPFETILKLLTFTLKTESVTKELLIDLPRPSLVAIHAYRQKVRDVYSRFFADQSSEQLVISQSGSENYKRLQGTFKLENIQ